MQISDFVLDQVFNRLDSQYDDRFPVWWAHTTDRDGYIMIWEDGNDFHTYRYPPDWY